MKKMLPVVLVLLASICAVSQSSTNAASFSVQLNFWDGTPYGQTQAVASAFGYQLTANNMLRADVITMPGVGYTGTGFGDQYSLCGISALEKALATTTLSCGKFSPYVNAAVGYGRIQVGSSPSVGGILYLFRGGANYDPTGAGTFTLNLFEGGWGQFGPSIAGQSSQGWFAQTGFSFGLGSNAAATAAKRAYFAHANAAKIKKLNDKIKKEQARKS